MTQEVTSYSSYSISLYSFFFFFFSSQNKDPVSVIPGCMDRISMTGDVSGPGANIPLPLI